MQLGLSSEAMPDASISDLLVACFRRGLGTLELVLGPGIGPDDVVLATRLAKNMPVRISGIVADEYSDTTALADLSRRAAAPVIVRGGSHLQTRIDCARAICNEGGTALAFVSGPPEAWLDAISDVGFAWHIDEMCREPAAAAERILHARTIPCIRLSGGGPETAMQGEQGIGALMCVLAIAGYTGPVIMTPSSRRYRVAWATWLGRRGGSGCGSKADASGGSVPINVERGIRVGDSC